MKYISSGLFIIGFIVTCIGICLGDANFLLSIKMMTGGVVTAGAGYILTEIYVWREEIKHGL